MKDHMSMNDFLEINRIEDSVPVDKVAVILKGLMFQYRESYRLHGKRKESLSLPTDDWEYVMENMVKDLLWHRLDTDCENFLYLGMPVFKETVNA